MSLEEKFEACMKSYQAVLSSSQELKNQNEYLRKQFGDVWKQKQKALASPTSSIHDEEGEEGNNSMSSSSERSLHEEHKEKEDCLQALMILELRFWNSKAN